VEVVLVELEEVVVELELPAAVTVKVNIALEVDGSSPVAFKFIE
jgi:hypothetical protein